MRYHDGAVIHQENDLLSSGFGIPWGHTRVYGNTLSQSTGGQNGNSWLVPQWQYLVQPNVNRIGIVRGVLNTMWFDKIGGSWVGEFSIQATLVEDTGNLQFVLTEPRGDLYRFHNFAAAANLQGRLKSVASAGDSLAELSYDLSTGNLTKFEQSSGSESVVYDYNYTGGGSTSGGGGLGLLQDVALKINGTTTRRAVYSYYGVSSANGNYNDLEKTTVQQWTSPVWKDLRTTYHRYWTSDAGAGVKHGLKYLLRPQGYLDMKAAGFPPESATNAKLGDDASLYFEYNAARGVSKEIVDGGKHTYTFAYETSNLADGNNNWKTRTTEGRPDGSEVIVYTNYAMGVILRMLKQGASKWYRYVKYDDTRYRAVLIASSEAVSSVNTPTASQALAVTLKSSEGLITTKSWYSSSSGVGAKDYLKDTAVKKGETGTEIKQRELEYTSNPVGSRTVYKVSKETLYLTDWAPLKTSVTAHTYTWHTGTVQIDQHTITLPTVPTGENGSGQSYHRKTAFDLKGRVRWEQDELGVINGYTYDAATGARKTMIQDSASGVGSGVPSGWSTSSSSPLGLETDYEINQMGRRTRALGPVHQIDLAGTPTNVRTANYTVYRDDLFEIRTAQGYESGGADTTVNPVTIEKRDADGRTIQEIQATRSGSGRLSANDTFVQSSYLRWQTRSFDDADQLVWERTYVDIPATQDDVGTKGTNYDQRHRPATITSWNNDTPGSGSVINQVQRTYDDFGQLTTDLQEPDGPVDGATLEVVYAYENGSDNTIRPTKTTYPDGREIEFTYGTGTPDDILSRVAGIKDLGKSAGTGDDKQLANYRYLGTATPVVAEYPEPAVELTYLAQGAETQLYGDPYNGLDWFGRIADQRWIKGGSDLERVTYGYSENSLKEWRRNTVATSADKQDESYCYDGLFQIKDRDRGVLTSGNVMTNITESEDWTYDASGNWLGYDHLEGGTTLSQTRTHSKVNEIATYNANATPREYDKAGNMTRIPEGVTTTSIYRVATWDAWNRLRRVRKTSGTGSTSGTNFDVWYDYDGLTRRTQKRIVGGPNQGTTSYYYNRSWKCLEERKSGVSGPSRQYVFGIRGRNDLILRDRDTNNSGIVLEERLYALTDAMGSVTAITDKAGAVKERFRYTAFGVSQVMTPAFGNRSISSYDWQTRFHGEQRDAETGYYNYGFRFYLPELGRWPSRDPIGERGGGNLYGFVRNSPVMHLDILGLAIKPCSDFDKTQVVGESTYGRTKEQNNKKIETNGCGSDGSGWVPDSYLGEVDFTSSCDKHDRCYATCGSDKDDCDEALKNNMIKECEERYQRWYNFGAI